MPTPQYRYEAQIKRWVDGDTVDMRVDCGFYTWIETRFRLAAIDTPERGQEGYAEATARVNELAPPGSFVVIETYKSADKYGRFLAVIWVGDLNVNQTLVAEGLATDYG